MFRKLTVIAVAALACSGAMAATETFNFTTAGQDAISFSGALTGGLTTSGSGWLGSTVTGYTGFGNVLLDGGTSGVTVNGTAFSGALATGYLFSVNSAATSHTISYDVISGGNGPAPVLTGSFGSVAHQATPISVTNTPIAAVPEPETYAMMLAGLGALGFVGRRRKSK